jgi:hypothetical protein
MRRLVAVAVALALPATGCLSNTYRIPRGELGRLASAPPEQRGEHVRVVQQFSTSEAPPPAQPVSSSTTVVVGVGVGIGGPSRPAPRRVGTGLPRTGGLAKSKSEEAWFWAIVAIGAAIGLAATEGARYDGWVRLHPMHPVHVWGPWGYAVVPLAQIDANTAAVASRAVIVPHEGPFETLGRAPLDRQGFTYSVLGGAAAIPSADGTTEFGPAFHIQLGYHPTHMIGVLGDAALSWRQNDFGRTVYDNRWGLELQVLPLDAGHFHGGVFGTVALGSRVEDGVAGGREQDVAFGGGAMLQASLTTRLALTARFGLGRAYGDDTKDITFGLSIY